MTKALLLKGAAVLATAVVAAGVTLVLTNGAGAAVPGPAQAWIDDPLDGAVVPPGPISIVAHAYDPTGVGMMTLWVDGVEIDTAAFSPDGQTLVFAQWSWVAVEDGVYVIDVFGHDAAGNPGLPGRAVITIGRDSGPAGTTTTTTEPVATTTTTAPPPTTTTPPPGTTTSPPATTTTTTPATTTTSPTTTTTTCPPGTPALVNPPDGFVTSPFFPAPPLEWAYRGCQITGFTVQLARDTGFSTGLVSQDFASTTTQWNVINGLEPGQWYWRVRALRGPQVGPWSTSRGFIKG